MNSLIESLNMRGADVPEFALTVLWQSSVLIALVFAFDILLRRKVRAAVRYTLWLVVFIKLILPPTLALPSGVAWWLRGHKTVAVTPTKILKVTEIQKAAEFNPVFVASSEQPRQMPKLSGAAGMLVGWVGFGGFLLAWVAFRWREIARRVRDTSAPTDSISELMAEARQRAGVRRKVTLRVTADAVSPAVCGLFRPIILLPQSLIERLSAAQLRAVLLHELIHLRRQDVWVNCAQTLLQIVYWWHPLLWFANARVRQVREEAVDDAVMVALSEEAEIYAPTLLEVAKLAFSRPLASLGLIGILESRNALRHRIERLLNFTTPRRAGISAMSLAGIVAFSAVAVPMGEPPVRLALAGGGSEAVPGGGRIQNMLDERKKVFIEAQFYQISPTDFALLDLNGEHNHRDPNSSAWWDFSREQMNEVQQRIRDLGLQAVSSPRIQTYDGSAGDLSVSDGTNSIEVECEPSVRSGFFSVSALVRTTGKYAPDSGHWPDLAGKTNCAIFARVNFPDGGGAVLRAQNTGEAVSDGGELIVLLMARTVEPVSMVSNKVAGASAGRSVTAGALLQEGKSLYELGKLDEAEVTLQKVLTIQTNNQAAIYYLSLIKQARIRKTVDERNQPGPGFYKPVYPLNETNLLTRTFKVDMRMMEGKLKESGDLPKLGDASANLPSALILYFRKMGVDLQAPKSVFLNDRKASVTFHATAEELDSIERAIDTLNTPPPQVTVRVWFVEADANYDGLNAVLTNGLGNSTNELSMTAAGALDDAAFRTLLKKLQQSDQVKLLNEGEVTTLSGREANFQVVTVEPVVIGRDKKTNASSGGYVTTNIPVGPIVDLVATVLPDGYSISLVVTPSLIKITGHHESPDIIDYNKPGNPPLQMPVFSTQTATFTTTLQDGQVLAIAGLSDNTENAEPNRAVSPPPFTEKGKQLIIFIRPVIIDGAGNRVHRDEQVHSKDYYDGPTM